MRLGMRRQPTEIEHGHGVVGQPVLGAEPGTVSRVRCRHLDAERDHRQLQRQRHAATGPLGEMGGMALRSEEHTSELQSLMRTSYAVFCLKKKQQTNQS